MRCRAGQGTRTLVPFPLSQSNGASLQTCAIVLTLPTNKSPKKFTLHIYRAFEASESFHEARLVEAVCQVFLRGANCTCTFSDKAVV